jgi:serine/threonine protein kinase
MSELEEDCTEVRMDFPLERVKNPLRQVTMIDKLHGLYRADDYFLPELKQRGVGKYALGRTIGGGTFAKVKFAINTDTGAFFALKVLAKDTILRNKMVEQVTKNLTVFSILQNFSYYSVDRGEYSRPAESLLRRFSVCRSSVRFRS